MTSHQAPRPRPILAVARRLGVLVSCVVALVLTPVVAFADTPDNWEKAPGVSGLQFLVVLVLIPAGLALLISLLAALPSMVGDKGYEPGQSWRSEPEWFGGASKGVEAAESVSDKQLESGESNRGGASGSW
ncbi:MAG: hypothetical protein J7518_17210 [Nocardioidaceae bacterium]|nr:hypothetical protein [Nocardioidaceae bacterium]